MNLDKKGIYKRVIVGFGIIILIMFIALISMSYENGVKRCIINGNSEQFCREELGK